MKKTLIVALFVIGLLSLGVLPVTLAQSCPQDGVTAYAIKSTNLLDSANNVLNTLEPGQIVLVYNDSPSGKSTQTCAGGQLGWVASDDLSDEPPVLVEVVPVKVTEEPEDLFGAPPRSLEIDSSTSNAIDWDEQFKSVGFDDLPGMVPGTMVKYVQSSVDDVLPLEDFDIPEGYSAIFGAVGVFIQIPDIDGDGAPDERNPGGGVYGVLPSGLHINKFTITNGFVLFTATENAQEEFCMRVAQAIEENWAHDKIYPDPTWSDPVCPGEYVVPLDSDRLNGGILPDGIPGPLAPEISSNS